MSSNDPNLIQLSIAALAKMIKFDLSTPGKETVGLLIGHEKNGVVYVEDVRLGDQTGNAVHVEVNEAELTQAAIEISERDDGNVIVGWIHTHPGLSAFMSGTDISTQKLYQAFMPNAIAIVLDPVQYSKTGNIKDLDMKVFRVKDEKAKEFRYTITDTVEFGLNTFITEDREVEVHSSVTQPTTYTIPVPNQQKLRDLRMKLDQVGDTMEEADVIALESWLELTEAIESGDVVEVPIEIDRLIKILDDSLGSINAEIVAMRQEISYRKAERTLFFIFFGLIIEFGFFYLLFGL